MFVVEKRISCDGQSQGVKRFVALLTQVLIVLIERMNDLGRTPLSTNGSSEQRLNDVIAESGVGGQRCDAVGGGGVTTGLADPLHQTLATDFGQVVSGVSGVVGRQFWPGDLGYLPGQIRDGKAGGLGGQSNDCGHNLPHPDLVEIDSGPALGSPLSRRR